MAYFYLQLNKLLCYCWPPKYRTTYHEEQFWSKHYVTVHINLLVKFVKLTYFTLTQQITDHVYSVCVLYLLLNSAK